MNGLRAGRGVGQGGVLGDADGIGLHVLGQIGLLDLAKNAFVKGAIGLRLAGQFLVTDGRFVQGEGGFLLILRRRSRDFSSAARGLREDVAQDGGLIKHCAFQCLLGFLKAARAAIIFGMLRFVTLRQAGDG